MKFSVVADTFDLIEKEASRNQITQLLASLLKQANPQEAAIICNLSLGELHPPYIESQFNIAQKSMVPVVARMLKISDDQADKKIKQMGDAGLVIAEGHWQQTNDDLTIREVYDRLNALQKISGAGSQEDKADALEQLLLAVDPISAKYIVRMVLGKLRLGFSDMTIIDALSFIAVGDKSCKQIIEDAYNSCADIGLIAQTLKKSGIDALKAMQITVGVPIRPAAAERLPTAQAIVEKLGPCVAQPKLDGFRLQIHLDRTGDEPVIKFFSRNLKNMSEMFPDLVQALLQLKVKTLICEGEAIGYDENTDRFLPFQETVKRKRKHGIEEAAQENPLKLFMFDLLYLNGKPQLEYTHEQRYQTFKKIMPNDPHNPLQLIKEQYVDTANELESYFLMCISEGLEGIVVKRPDAIYQPGKRNFNWIKLKRQEEGTVEDTLDCVILGYYAGAGKRASFGIGAFLVGIYNKKDDRYQTVAKVGTGLSDAAWKELKAKCDAIKVKEQPHDVVCPKELAPDVWVMPKLVCMIRADEITRSPLHTASRTADQLGLALRFPRFMGYRDDKDATDATTATELMRMYADQKLIRN
jgi:DNA ligase-1